MNVSLTDWEAALYDFERAVSDKLRRDPLLRLPFVAGGSLAKMRARLIEEEAAELVAALLNEDLAAVAKESADLKYVTFGTDVALGIPSWPVFRRVHDNNLAKVTGGVWDGQKLLKPKNHPKVSLGDLLP